MHTLHPANTWPDQYELSRHAAERYAVLTAVKEKRALKRRSPRPRRVIDAVPQPIAIHD